jgi:L-ascorbate metabolism protein UlaG (beta-lactamase superfamily)
MSKIIWKVVALAFLSSVFMLYGCTGTATVQTASSSSPTTSEKPVLISSAPASLSSPQTLEITWLGHSSFLITSSQGTRVLIDPPNEATGYSIVPVSAIDVILVSHEHADHNNVALATGSPLVLRGLNSTGWNSIDQKVKDTRIISISPAIPVFHDSQQGAQRGRNTIFIIEMDGMRLAHFGDLGHVLTQEMSQAIGSLDIAFIPVGGSYTIDATAATQVVGQINSRIVIPMHYKTPKLPATWPGTGVEPFLEGKKVERPNTSSIKVNKTSIPNQTSVVVLNYK